MFKILVDESKKYVDTAQQALHKYTTSVQKLREEWSIEKLIYCIYMSVTSATRKISNPMKPQNSQTKN